MPNNAIWFSDLDRSLKFTTRQIEEIGKIINQAVVTGKIERDIFPELSRDQDERIIFLSRGGEDKSLFVYIGKGKGILNALNDVFLKLLQDWEEYKEAEIIKIDIVTDVKSPGKFNLYDRFLINKTLDGIAFSKESNVALIPELISANAIINDKGYIDRDRLYNAIAGTPLTAANYAALERKKISEVFIFRTFSLLIKNNQIRLLYRGSPEVNSINIKDLEYRLKLAAQYLARHVYPSGKFDYLYRADKNISYPEYNIIRHAGTIYSMFEYCQIFPDQHIMQSAKRALSYLTRHILPYNNGNSLCLTERGNISLGGNALAAVALSKYIEVSGEQKYLPLLLKLGEWMIGTLNDGGEFKPQREFYLKEMPYMDDYISLYYPGEAILAFLRIYSLDKNPKWLDSAEKAVLWLINVRDKDVKKGDLNHDHWLLYSLNELHRYRPNSIFLEHAARICEAIFSAQHIKGEYPDWHGGFYKPPRSTPAATRSEGMLSAYFLIKDFGNDENLLERLLISIKNSVAFQFKTQYLPEYAMYFPNPNYALGGFRSSLTEHSIRIDFVQHNISSLLGFYKIMGGYRYK